MSIVDSINTARSRGASEDDILNEVLNQNPTIRTSVETARQRGADSGTILNEISSQNTTTPGPAQHALDVVKGAGKELASQAVSVVRTGGDIMRGIRATVSPKTYEQLRQEDVAKEKGTPLEALVSGSDSARTLDERLKSTNPWQTAGKVGAFIGTLFVGGITKPVTAAERALATKTELATLRISPTAARELGAKKIAEVGQTLTDMNLIGGQATRYQKATKAAKAMEDAYQSALASSKGKISTMSLKIALQDAKKTLVGKNPAETFSIERDINEAVNILNTKGQWLSLPEVNLLKRSFTDRAYSGQWNHLNDITQLAIGGVFKNAVETTAKAENILIKGQPVDAFNKAYGKLLEAKSLLKAAQGRPETGMLTKIIAYTTGAGLGYSAGGLAGAAVGPVVASKLAQTFLGTASKSVASSALQTAARAGEKARGALMKLIPR